MPEEPERRLEIHGVLRHECKKHLILARYLADAVLQLIDELDVAGDTAQVEEDVGMHQRLFLGHGDPAMETVLPFT